MSFVQIDQERCKGCALCIEFCHHGTLALAEVRNTRGYVPAAAVRPETCTGCTVCAVMCPDACIRVFRSRRRDR